ncbi:hypothetical protein XELAEV_18008575mg [Xenopus laevis]|uniref:Uncharacterized protein n=1 Tax=Xenopus laevis TaxID=8355 RepID=A0A974E2V5_XENLA|nr:hypothetical protein XELAEV_18008575mg [Xenopus laevis]
MATADLRVELSCSICLSIYTDPVSLPCAHNFCRDCIGTTWDTQEETFLENPSCPECRQRFSRRPELTKDWKLCDLVERFRPTETEPGETGIFCTYCVLSPVPAAKSCLLCEASLCDTHLRGHSKSAEHREETERGAQRLQERRREVAEKAAGETERVTALFRDIREQLEALEEQLLSEISSQKEEISLQLTDLMEQLEIKKDELSWKIHHIEELCNMADPLTVLQERESHGAADNEGGRERHDIKVPAVGDLDVDLISETLLTGLAAIVTGVKGRIYGQEATDLLLDINTAGNHVSVSGDRKSASYSLTDQCHPQSPERFQVPQTLSSRSFPSGRHYWEVEVSESGYWMVGVAYPSIERGGVQSCIGNNNKSWCLFRRRIRISLDYEAGHLSFYELSEPIRHLHTFTATFTEPLHAAFWVGRDGNACVRIIRHCPAPIGNGNPFLELPLPSDIRKGREYRRHTDVGQSL